MRQCDKLHNTIHSILPNRFSIKKFKALGHIISAAISMSSAVASPSIIILISNYQNQHLCLRVVHKLHQYSCRKFIKSITQTACLAEILSLPIFFCTSGCTGLRENIRSAEPIEVL